jgi:hypothetical protein
MCSFESHETASGGVSYAGAIALLFWNMGSRTSTVQFCLNSNRIPYTIKAAYQDRFWFAEQL